jgi:hypothetical protein
LPSVSEQGPSIEKARQKPEIGFTGSVAPAALARFISAAMTGANSVFMANGMAGEFSSDPNCVSNFELNRCYKIVKFVSKFVSLAYSETRI